MKEKITWEEVIDKFNIFEQKLQDNIQDDYVMYFFDSITEDLKQSAFEKWQLIEIQQRVTKVRTILNQMKHQIHQDQERIDKHYEGMRSYLKAVQNQKDN